MVPIAWNFQVVVTLYNVTDLRTGVYRLSGRKEPNLTLYMLIIPAHKGKLQVSMSLSIHVSRSSD